MRPIELHHAHAIDYTRIGWLCSRPTQLRRVIIVVTTGPPVKLHVHVPNMPSRMLKLLRVLLQ